MSSALRQTGRRARWGEHDNVEALRRQAVAHAEQRRAQEALDEAAEAELEWQEAEASGCAPGAIWHHAAGAFSGGT